MRVRPPLLIGLILLALSCASRVSPPATTLRRRVRKLRARQRAIHRQRRTLDRERDAVEGDINALRARLDQLAPPTVDETTARTEQLGEVETQIDVYESKKKQLDRTLADLTAEAARLGAQRNEALARLQRVSLDTIVAVHASRLPRLAQGTLRKSAWALTPFLDMMFAAADTNTRVVAQVGEEIERYTSVDVGASPFMNGMLFYCVLLVPALALCVLARAAAEQSAKLRTAHTIIFGNMYLLAVCAIFFVANLLHRDPMRALVAHHLRLMVVANLAVALYFLWLLITLALQSLDTKQVHDLAQLVATATIALHYFLFAWRRIFTNQQPALLIHHYLIYATILALVAYERCVRINARWFTGCSFLPLFRETDAPLLDFGRLFNRNNLHAAQRQLVAWWQRANASFNALLQRVKRGARKRCKYGLDVRGEERGSRSAANAGRGGRRLAVNSCFVAMDAVDSGDESSTGTSSSEDEEDSVDEPLSSRTSARVRKRRNYGQDIRSSESVRRNTPSPARGGRRHAGNSRFFAMELSESSEESSAASSSSGYPEESDDESLLARTSARFVELGKATGVWASRSRSGSGSGEGAAESRRWWSCSSNSSVKKLPNSRTPNRHAKYERSNARPRKEKDIHVFW